MDLRESRLVRRLKRRDEIVGGRTRNSRPNIGDGAAQSVVIDIKAHPGKSNPYSLRALRKPRSNLPQMASQIAGLHEPQVGGSCFE